MSLRTSRAVIDTYSVLVVFFSTGRVSVRREKRSMWRRARSMTSGGMLVGLEKCVDRFVGRSSMVRADFSM